MRVMVGITYKHRPKTCFLTVEFVKEIGPIFALCFMRIQNKDHMIPLKNESVNNQKNSYNLDQTLDITLCENPTLEEKDFFHQRIREVQGQKTDNKILYVKMREKIVGGAVLAYIGNCLFIESLWVDPDYRGKKIGSHLIETVEQSALAQGLDKIYVETLIVNVREFFRSHAYEIVAIISNINPGTDWYVLSKKVQQHKNKKMESLRQ